jgi:flagellar basal body rod protein FlgG
MALDGIFAAVSALRVTEKRVNQTAHNVANVSTTGFTPRRVEQADVQGGGVQATGTTPLSSGPLLSTERSLDLAIDGGGFFVLDDGQGGRLYTRAGNFSLNADGQLVDPMGRTVLPAIEVPAQAASLHISAQGQVQALAEDGTVLSEGQIQTAAFGNAGGLEAVGGNAFRATQASGPPVTATPGSAGHGEIVSGALQASGTDLAKSMVDMIIDQRTFEANLKSLETQDELLGTIMDIKA